MTIGSDVKKMHASFVLDHFRSYMDAAMIVAKHYKMSVEDVLAILKQEEEERETK